MSVSLLKQLGTMTTILKINDVENILEVTPPNEDGMLEIWIGLEVDQQSWRSVALDRKETENLIRCRHKHLEELF